MDMNKLKIILLIIIIYMIGYLIHFIREVPWVAITCKQTSI